MKRNLFVTWIIYSPYTPRILLVVSVNEYFNVYGSGNGSKAGAAGDYDARACDGNGNGYIN